jgi:hypothetical protein
MKKRTKTGNNFVRLTAHEKANLERFGCAFNAGKSAFFIDWSGKTAKQASAANIFANFRSVETKAGPLVVLAFAISVRRPFPNYFYFPFDLTNQVHLKYIRQFIKTGRLKLNFVCGKRVVCRTHQLGAYDLWQTVPQRHLEWCNVVCTTEKPPSE